MNQPFVTENLELVAYLEVKTGEEPELIRGSTSRRVSFAFNDPAVEELRAKFFSARGDNVNALLFSQHLAAVKSKVYNR